MRQKYTLVHVAQSHYFYAFVRRNGETIGMVSKPSQGVQAYTNKWETGFETIDDAIERVKQYDRDKSQAQSVQVGAYN